jgi:hypothetical protein
MILTAPKYKRLKRQQGIAILGAMTFAIILLIAGAALLSVASNTVWMVERTEESERTLLAAENAMNLVLAYLQSEITADGAYPVGTDPLVDLIPPFNVEGVSVTSVLTEGPPRTLTVTATAPANSGNANVVLGCDILWNSANRTVNYNNWRIEKW